MSSRYSSAGGSRYPSAYGHTPSYRSYVKGDIGVDAAYPSALGEKIFLKISSCVRIPSSLTTVISAGSSGIGSGSRSAALTDFDLNMPLSSSSLGGGLGSGLGGTSSSNASSRQVQQSYSSYSSSSADGGRPHVEFSKDSTYRDDH